MFYTHVRQNTHRARAPAYNGKHSPNRRGALNMHETLATATFAIPLQHATSKCCCGSNLGDILHTDTYKTLATATCPCGLHICHITLSCLHYSTSMLLPPAAAEWAKPSRSAAALVARQACEITLNRRCIAPPTPLLARHLDLRILKHSLFLRFYTHFRQKTHRARPPAYNGQHSPNRRGALNMHETQATATFAIPLQQAISKCCSG